MDASVRTPKEVHFIGHLRQKDFWLMTRSRLVKKEEGDKTYKRMKVEKCIETDDKYTDTKTKVCKYRQRVRKKII